MLPDCPCDDTAGLLYVGWLPFDGLSAGLLEPVDTELLCLVTVCRAADVPPDDFEVVTLLRDEPEVPKVPRPVLLLEPTPLRTVVLLLPLNTRSSLFSVSCRGPYHVLLEKWPPLPSPGPCP